MTTPASDTIIPQNVVGCGVLVMVDVVVGMGELVGVSVRVGWGVSDGGMGVGERDWLGVIFCVGVEVGFGLVKAVDPVGLRYKNSAITMERISGIRKMTHFLILFGRKPRMMNVVMLIRTARVICKKPINKHWSEPLGFVCARARPAML